MAGERPIGGYILTLIAGVFMMLGAVSIIIVGGDIRPYPFGLPDYSHVVCGSLGVLLAVVVIIGGIMTLANPNRGVVWGSVIVVLSILSWIVAIGGLIIGSLLGIIGGILFIAWKPGGPAPMRATAAGPSVESITTRGSGFGMVACRNCRQMIDVALKKCPYCGQPTM